MNSVRLCLSRTLMSIPLVLSISACDHRPKVVIEGGETPRFNLTGEGKIQVITVSGPDLERPAPKVGQSQLMKPYWVIVPNGDYDLRSLDGPIVYGQVPKGFHQNFPANGVPPQTLFESGLFTFQLSIADGKGLGVRFTIHEGEVLIEGS